MFTLDAKQGCAWHLTIRRTDGHLFENGTFQLHFSARDLAEGVRKATGETWRGTFLRRTTLSVAVEPATTPEARAAEHRLAARAALDEGNTAEAIRRYELAVAAAPNDLDRHADLGFAYLQGRRFREAVNAYRVALPLAQRERSMIPEMLALAYLGLGDEPSAAAVLSSTGTPSQQVTEKLRQLRLALPRLGRAAIK